MRAVLHFTLRRVIRRPRRFLSMAAVSAAILTTLIMVLLYFDADWRARVMPDNQQNYHFSLYNLTDREKQTVRSKDWVQETYDIYYDNSTDYSNEFRVRVDWDHVLSAGACCREVLLEFGLVEREPYATQYQNFYDRQVETMINNRRDPATIPAEASKGAVLAMVRMWLKNTSFCNETVNTYVMRPEFLLHMSLFALYLGSAMCILTAELYRSDLPEFGSLRALGMKGWQITGVNLMYSLFTSLASIPAAMLLTAAIVKIYTAATAGMLSEGIYYTLMDEIPVGAVLILAGLLTAASLAGTYLVCRLNRNLTAMEMLRGGNSYQVSFVAKTSPRFERAKSAKIYSRLYIFRTRRSFLLRTLIVAMMIPLPCYYLNVIFLWLSHPALEVIYHVVQAVIVFATSMTVIYVSARSDTEQRHPEFAILRAIGQSKRAVRRMAFPPALVQTVTVSLSSMLLYSWLMNPYAALLSNNPGRLPGFFDLIASVTSNLPGILILVAPPLLFGVTIALRRFFKRSMIENIRSTE
ncbi:MAG: ABC transporter permease [Clostridia bacterium]|nr:ABC transporter permease [Clostridia bacterium]